MVGHIPEEAEFESRRSTLFFLLSSLEITPVEIADIRAWDYPGIGEELWKGQISYHVT